MNNVNMGGMNAMGGPVGGGIPVMNNGAAPGARQAASITENSRSQLNTYIYEYFLRNNMYDCARSLLNSDTQLSLVKDSPGRRDGAGDEGGDGDSKDDLDKRPDDLPMPNLPRECPESCFLYEWWCLFWDMFNAQRGKGDGRNVLQYVNHTQAQSRLRQEQQQQMLRGLRGDMSGMPPGYQQMMMRNQAANGMNLSQQELRQKAIQNNRNATPQQIQMLQQQKQQQQAQQQQMQRDPSEGNSQQRPQSPGSAENAPSPSKRPRLDGTPFNPQQMPNGRGQPQGMPQQVGENGPSNAIQTAHMQLTNGIEPNNLTGPQFQNIPGGANASAQARTLAGYQATLAQQQAGQMPGVKGMPNPGGPQNQGSPMMSQGQDGGAIANYYNPGDVGPNGMRGVPGGQAGGTGGNHALQDYQMQLMLLEQQNKKRLMMARQEQDSMSMPRPDGSAGPGGPAMGPNGQPFQGTSPQGPRSVNSPNPGEQMKRGTPHMNPGGMPSPLPEGQSRGSPSSGMNFNLPPGPMDPSMNPQYFKMNGMDPNMVGAMSNGMRPPPSSHPAGGFQGQMTPQQMALARQQQQQQQGGAQNWQAGPNGQMMPQQPTQGTPQQQNMGTPQQRAMPPPSAPAAGAANGRTQPSSPQQGAAPPTPQQANKANPKKKNESKDSKAKRAAKKGSAANLNAGATPSAEPETAGATPTPATPITPVHPKSFNGQNGAVQPATNGQAAPAVNTNVVSQPDVLQQNFGMDNGAYDFSSTLEFAGPNNGNLDVLQDFDFDSFLHNDGEGVDNFNFDAGFMDGNEIGAE